MSEPRKGFSLVLSLTIMALMVLVVLTIAGFLNLESRLAATRLEFAKAQLNALGSARLAIGHIQMLAGPDQRVTARADIFDGGASNSYLSMPALSAAQQSSFGRKRNWVGVWCTGGADSTKARDWNPTTPDDRIFLGWLVSPQASLATDPGLVDPAQLPFVLPDKPLADSTGTGGKGRPLITGTSLAAMITPWTAPRFIPLLDLGTLNYTGRTTYAAGTDPDKVELPPAALPGVAAGTVIGNYAWWVGDCGMKAKYSLADTATLTQASPANELPGLTEFGRSFRTQAGRFAVELMGTGAVGSRPFKDMPALWDADVKAAIAAGLTYGTMLQRTTERQSLRNWGNKLGGATADAALGDALGRHYHDATNASYGVLSDTLNGGLRRDLSVAFELPFSEYATLAEFNDSPGDNGDINGKSSTWSAGFNLAATMGITTANTPSAAEWMNPDRKLGFVYELPIYPSSLYTGRSQAQSNPASSSCPAIVRGPTWDLLRNYYRLYKRELEQVVPEKRRGQPAPAADAWVARGSEPFTYAIGDAGSLQGQPNGYWAFRANASLMTRKNAAGQYNSANPVQYPIFANHPHYGNNIGPIPQHTAMKLAPNVVRTGFIFSTVWTDTKLGISMDPRVTLHNPYNVPLELNGMGMSLGKFYKLNFAFLRSDTGATVGTIDLQPMYFYGRYLTFRIFENAGTRNNPTGTIRLEPGELRTYCAAPDTAAQVGEVVGAGDSKNIPGVFNYGTTGQNLVYRLGTYPDTSTWGSKSIRVKAGFGYTAATGNEDSYCYETGQVDFHLFFNQLDNGTTVNAATRSWYGIENTPECDTADEHLVHRIQFLPRGLPTAQRVVTSADIAINSPVNTPFVMMDLRARAWDDSGNANLRADTTSPLFINHRAQLLDYRNQDGDANAPAGWALEFYPVNSLILPTTSTGVGFEISGARNNSFWGKSWSSASGQSKVVLYQVPTRPLLSLAGLASADYTHTDMQAGLTVGNSYCPPGLTDPSKLMDWPNSTGSVSPGTENSARLIRYDATWASNHALYDRYFFSGAFANEPSSYGATAKVDATQADTLSTLFAGLQMGLPAFANKRVRWLLNPNNTLADFRNPAKTAKAIVHDGTFNVNSTSKDAWKAFLGGLRGQKLPGATKAADALSPFSRFDRVSADHDDTTNPAARFRALTDAEIDTLADQVVLQVRQRGPFMCLADFVNRRLMEDKPTSNDMQLKGALQAAIDAAGINGTAPLNATFGGNTSRHPMGHALSVDGRSASAAQAALGATGMLLQSDILNAAGASLSARSDTFVVRAYGEAVDVTGRPSVGAWIELTVQRMPEMIVPDDNEPNIPDPSYRTSAVNGATPFMDKFKPNPAVKKPNRFLGRRFKVIAVRWLAPNEV